MSFTIELVIQKQSIQLYCLLEQTQYETGLYLKYVLRK
jgi:hypothetical protein